MVSHLSAVKEVLGLPAHDVFFLEEHCEHFSHDQAMSFAESSSNEDDPVEPASGATFAAWFNSSD